MENGLHSLSIPFFDNLSHLTGGFRSSDILAMASNTLHVTVLKFQFNRACFQGEKASANFGGKVESEQEGRQKIEQQSKNRVMNE